MDSLIFAALETLLQQLGRATLWLVTLGRWRGEPTLGNEGRIYGAAGALSFVREGRRVVTHTGLLLVGALSAIALLIAALAIAAWV